MQHRAVCQGLLNGGIQHRRMRRADGIRAGRLAAAVPLNHITQKLTWLGGYSFLRRQGGSHAHIASLYAPNCTNNDVLDCHGHEGKSHLGSSTWHRNIREADLQVKPKFFIRGMQTSKVYFQSHIRAFTNHRSL